ncbi:MAG: hypothetical protein RLZZ15_65 [Verrucomicrobiota bacterium]
MAENAQRDFATMRAAGLAVEWATRSETFHRAWVTIGDERLKLEWVFDSAFRFFPVEPDPVLGYRLHPADLATNKMLAAAGRRVIRDFLDVLHLHETYLSLGALAWAATGKDPGMSPLFILNELVRTSKYQPKDLEDVTLARPISLVELKQKLLGAVREAEELIGRLPASEVGCLYLDAAGKVVTPDPEAAGFAGLTRHFGSLRGSWPRVVEDENEGDGR